MSSARLINDPFGCLVAFHQEWFTHLLVAESPHFPQRWDFLGQLHYHKFQNTLDTLNLHVWMIEIIQWILIERGSYQMTEKEMVTLSEDPSFSYTRKSGVSCMICVMEGIARQDWRYLTASRLLRILSL